MLLWITVATRLNSAEYWIYVVVSQLLGLLAGRESEFKSNQNYPLFIMAQETLSTLHSTGSHVSGKQTQESEWIN